MKDFTYYNPTKIVFGRNSLEALPIHLKKMEIKKIFITFGKGSLKGSKLYNDLKEQLKDFQTLEFWGIEPNPRVETLRQAVKIAIEYDPDLVLAVGGGSVIDGSKLIAASIYAKTDPWELVLDISKAKIIVPLACILTVAATGTESDSFAVITNWEKQEKLAFAEIGCNPVISILNPENTFTVNRDHTAFGIIDIYSHVLEQYLTTTENAPLQDRLSEGILLTLIENGPKLLDDLNNYDLRANIMWCSTLALNGIIGSGVNQDWATHQIEHQVSAFSDIPHGAGLAIITPRWMKEVINQKMRKFAQYGRRIWNLAGPDEKVAEEAITKTYVFFKSLGVKMNLTEWGITNKDFPTMISRLAKETTGEFPLSKDQFANILNNCLSN